MHKVRYPLPEALPAGLALKRPLPGVDPLVVLQRGELLEGAAALRASVRLLVRVVQHVLVVRLLEGEGAAAQVADVGHLASVEPLVLLQEVLGGERLVASLALPSLVGGGKTVCC